MANNRILVTGGAGYIGAHTCFSLYDAGYEPVIVDNLSRSDTTLLQGLKQLTRLDPIFVEADCTDSEALRKVFRSYGPIAGVIHFAALKSVGESVHAPLIYYQNNIQSLTVLLEVMKENRVKNLIFSSSCTVYGQPDQIPVPESAPMKRAESPYGATKQMCERILEDASRTGFRFLSLRYFNPIGAHPSSLMGELPIGVPSNLVPFITQTAIGKRDKLVVFGDDYNTPDGSCVRDYIHVMDVASAHVKAMMLLADIESGNYNDAINLGTGSGVSVFDLLKRFMQVSGVKVNYAIGPRRPGDVEMTYADAGKATQVLGWKPTFSIDEALRDAWNWEKALASIHKS